MLIDRRSIRWENQERQSGDFVGEVAYHFDLDSKSWLTNVIIYAKYRHKGYGTEGLKLLCQVAKENGISELYDDIAIDNSGISIFLKSGFVEEYRTDQIIMLKKLLTD